MATVYRLYLTDGVDSVELPVSSFSYSKTDDDDITGSCVVEGHDFATEIALYIDESIKITKDIDGTETEILVADFDGLDTHIGSSVSSYGITFSGGVFSGTASDLTVDDLISYAGQQSGNWSFRLHEIKPEYQPGILASYNTIEYYIKSVSVSWTPTGGTTTMTEGTQGVTGGGGSCSIDTIAIGDTITDTFTSGCYATVWVSEPEASKRFFYYEQQWSYLQYSCFIKVYELYLDDETAINITIDSALPIRTVTQFGVTISTPIGSRTQYYGGSKGFVGLISTGQISDVHDQIKNNSFVSIGPTTGMGFSGTLPAGYYTIKLIYWAPEYVTPTPNEYTISVTESV